MQMQNPSQGLAAPLQNHVHLISGHRFPLIAALSIEQALTYLLDAPTIVKTVAPMSWQYVPPPQDGTLWLEWLSPDRSDARFPSDGYIWGDSEATYRHEHRGYTIEMMRHTIGYRMNFDQMASHARTRYHIIAKNPSVNAPPPDPALWIVHYHHADQGRMLPSSQVPFTPQMQQIMNERRWLESQGKLEKRDFMLHDRGSWPMINVPSSGGMPRPPTQQGPYGQVGQPNRYPQYWPQQQQQQQQQGQAPPAKRQRTNPPVPGGSDGVHDTSIEDEENTTLGDFFDHLTPRDISMTRYMQHHRWMEEVFSSPYASNQIVPPDLGLGLMGELKGLTEGILEPPSLDFAGTDKPTPKAKEAQPFTNLKKEQIDEFNRRVEKHLEDGQAEIEKMKEEHAKKMHEWKKTKTLMQAEKRLRNATWEGHESAVPVFRLEETAANGHAETGAQKETVEDVVKDVEELLGVKVSGHKEASMVEKGGLEKEETPAPQPLPQVQIQQSNMIQQQASMMGQQQQQPPTSSTAEPTIYHGDPMRTGLSQQQYPQAQQQQQPQAQMAPPAQHNDMPGQQSALDDSGMNDTSMMEGMDVDVDDSNIDFGDDSQFDVGADEGSGAAVPSANEPSLQAPGAQNSDATNTITPQTQAAHLTTFSGSAGQQAPAQQPASTEPGAITSETNIGANALVGGATAMGSAEDIGEEGADDMFNDNTFDDLTNMEDTGGDDFINFESGGMGMDDSAFGEAMHGMGTPGDASGQGEGGVGGQQQGGGS